MMKLMGKIPWCTVKYSGMFGFCSPIFEFHPQKRQAEAMKNSKILQDTLVKKIFL